MIKNFIIKVCKKRKFKASLIINLKPKIKNNKFNIVNISNIKNKSKTWFWNNYRDRNDLIKKKKKVNNKNKLNSKVEKSKIVSQKIYKKIK